MRLSEHFTLQEATASDTALRLGIDNTPAPEVIATIKHTASRMEVVRDFLDHCPIRPSSWFRCLALNAAIGSKPTSQHIRGEAVDFTCWEFGDPREICCALRDSSLDFDQLIYEHTWVHISFSADPNRPNRRQVLTLLKDKSYAVGVI